jgi:heme oxygenase
VSDGFSAQLRATTVLDHDAAQSVAIVEMLFRGTLPREAYVAMVAQHYFVYRELEHAAEAMRDDAIAGEFVFDELTREPALQADLQFLVGDDWGERIEMADATLAYCNRIREVCSTSKWPGGFVAHHYTRYLGDLSGGQAIAGAVARAYGLDDDGLRFYRFERIPDPATFKDHYRKLLDAAPWDELERSRIVEEIARAYRHNTELLVELGRACS